MKKRKLLIWVASILLLLIIGILGFLVLGKTTFGKIIDQSLHTKDEISHIIIQAPKDIKDDSFWTRIDDPNIIKQLITSQSEITLRKSLTNNRSKGSFYTMTIQTPSKSYYFDFDNNYFVANGLQYNIVEGSIISNIQNMKNELEWKTIDEFMEQES